MPTPGTGVIAKKKPRPLTVYNFKDACKALRAALDEVDALKTDHAKTTQIKEDEWVARRRAETDATTAREQFGDLKQRLLNSETECARLRGYLERVREDDAVADPLVEVEDGNGKRFVSKRHPTPRFDNYGGAAIGSEYATDSYGNRREKPKHWITY